MLLSTSSHLFAPFTQHLASPHLTDIPTKRESRSILAHYENLNTNWYYLAFNLLILYFDLF
jgi:hypothetical protein